MKICSFIYFPLDSSKYSVSSNIKIHTDDEPCPITFCERLCFEMTTDLDETRLQRNKTDQHLSTGCLQLYGLSIRGHAMLSHEGLPPEHSIDLNLIEVGNTVNVQIAPIRLCMCNMHTSLCNESLTLKVGTIQIRQLLRLYPGSWLEAGSVSVPELRINAKFECHPSTPATINEQLEFLATNSNILSCACLGGSTNYYTLVQGEQLFKSTFRLSDQSSFGRSLFHPELHVLHSHFIFEHKYNWTNYEHVNRLHDESDDEEIFYLFGFCGQQKQSNEQHQNINNNPLRHRSDDYLTPNEHLPLKSASQTSLNLTLNNRNDIIESSSISSLAMMQQKSSTLSSPMHSDLNIFLTSIGNKQNLSTNSSTDSLTVLEEILQRQQTRNSLTFLPQKGTSSNMGYNTVPQPSLPSSLWISLRNQMKMCIPKSTLLCTTYIRYLSHYLSSTWSNNATFPANIQ
ncbi:unnamed protein product [Adineta steineri]|uniref:Uncharacterized protein n=1 Tax=Adineta steineri TaxID=433720 RepID=A0A816DCP8_9BILA|nr:unnamed protein product [Adineta steineri]CAF1635573.1 unnamed protein product [Adineta steineri]